MIYQIKFSKQATAYIRKLPDNIQARIKKKFKEIAENPSRFIKHFEGKSSKIRIGGYRALVDIDNNRKIIFIRIFDKRGRIYKR